MRRVRLSYALVLLLLVTLLPLPLHPQQSHPRVRPGELPADTGKLEPINILTEWEYEVDGSTVRSPMMIEYDRLLRQGEVVAQIRWLASGGSWPAYDLMLVDQESFRLYVRHEPLPEGGFRVSNWHDGSVSTAVIPLRGEVEAHDQPTAGHVFDIATLPLLLATVPWSEFDGFDVALGDYDSGTTDWAPIRNRGRTVWEDTDGEPHPAWQVEYVDFEPGRSIHYYVSERPPYWIGMEIREPDGTASTSLRVHGFQLRSPSMAEYVDRLAAERSIQ